MKFLSQIVTAASGSVNGLVASHNRGGRYFRARTTPTDPNTLRQQEVRQALQTLAVRWGGTLTPANRASWALYAANVSVLNALGESTFLTGQQWYITSNVPRIQLGGTIVDAAPTTFDRGSINVSAASLSVATGLSVTFDGTVLSEGLADSWLGFYMGQPVGVGVSFFKGPFRLAAAVEGDIAASPNVITTANLPFVPTAGQRVWVKVSSSTADARLAQAAIFGPILVSA